MIVLRKERKLYTEVGYSFVYILKFTLVST